MLGPRASYSYSLNRKHSLSAIARLAGNRFVYTEREVPLYDSNGDIVDPSVTPSLAASAVASIGYNYNPIPPWQLRLEVGTTVARRLEFTERDDDRTLRLADGRAL